MTNYKIKIEVLKFLNINPFNAELNLICHLLALLGAHYILHVSRVRVKWYHNTLFEFSNIRMTSTALHSHVHRDDQLEDIIS